MFVFSKDHAQAGDRFACLPCADAFDQNGAGSSYLLRCRLPYLPPDRIIIRKDFPGGL